jgi:hypothetical protein
MTVWDEMVDTTFRKYYHRVHHRYENTLEEVSSGGGTTMLNLMQGKWSLEYTHAILRANAKFCK